MSCCEFVETEADGVHVLAVHGELDLDSAPDVCARLDAARLNGARAVLLDLTDLSFCDSQGLRALIEEQREMRASGKRFAVVAPAERAVTRLFELVGVRAFLRLFASRPDAVRYLTAA